MKAIVSPTRALRGPVIPTAFAPAILAVGLMASTSAGANTCETTNLVAGQNTTIGSVEVCLDDDTVTLTTDAPWCIGEAHLAVGADLDAIPQTGKGNPKPGRFDYSEYPATCDPVTFDLSGAYDIVAGTYIATHAYVYNQDTYAEESAWGAPYAFPGDSWATYFIAGGGTPALACGDDDSSKCVFATSDIFNGSFNGVPGANQICQFFANLSPLAASGTYKAWIADTSLWPANNFAQATVPYKLVDGTQIAANWADLIDGSLDNPIDLDETGVALADGEKAWTNVNTNGTAHFTADTGTCYQWTSSSGITRALALVGETDSDTATWTDLSTTGGTSYYGCNKQLRLYCFQQ